jgi:hypothetical protein
MVEPRHPRAQRTPFALAAAATATLLAVAASCGGAKNNDLFGGAPGAGGSDAGRTDATVFADGGPGPSGDGSTSFDAPFDAPKRDAGRDADTDPGIRCGSSTNPTFCAVGSQVCCRSGGPGQETFACVSSAGCNAVNQMPIPCSDDADCAALGDKGKVCCGTVDPFTNRTTEVSCKSSGDCSPANDGYILCDPRAPNCVHGGTCRLSSQTLPGFYLCF